MALQNTDNFLVNRSGTSYKVTYQELNATADQAATDAAQASSDAAQASADAATALVLLLYLTPPMR
jgi:hypothetical protein